MVDSQDKLDYSCFQNKAEYTVYDLKKLIEILRGPDGCPWDREQTHESISRNLLEEAYEAAEAIAQNDTDSLCEELGDVLMQVVFHSDIEEKLANFSLDDVAGAACRKLISRHPHIFGGQKKLTGAEVLANWDALKNKEKKHKTISDEMVAVARSLPALWRAEKVQQKAAKAGFDWPDYTGALVALKSELQELCEVVNTGGDVAQELGDLIFSAVNLARFFQIDPEEALTQSTDKFVFRFKEMEHLAAGAGLQLEGMPLEKMDKLYDKAKILTHRRESGCHALEG